MQSLQTTPQAAASPPFLYRTATALLVSLSLFTTGCLSPLAKHSTALAAATAPVVDQAADAYRSANSLHDLRIDYEAVANFDNAAPNVYNPRNIQPLLSGKDVQVRLAVLAAFQEYVTSIVAITRGTDSPELQAASVSTGKKLTSLGNTLAPSVESTFGIAAASASTDTSAGTAASAPTDPITPGMQNRITLALDAFAQFLIGRKVKAELPHIVQAMDPELKVLGDLLESDLAILRGQETRDYNFIINRQTLFLRTSTNLDPELRREEIMKLPGIVRQQRISDDKLTQLNAAIARLELTHHAFAAEAQGNNPESLSKKLNDLEAAGKELTAFYISLSKESTQ